MGETESFKTSADVIRRAKEAGLDLMDAEVLIHYLRLAAGDMNRAIVLAEATGRPHTPD